MKKVQITYNPYYVSTGILVDGKSPKLNSDLNRFSDECLRLTEWAESLPQILINEYSDSNYEIDFIGSETDYRELCDAFLHHEDVISTRFNHIKIIPAIDLIEKKVVDIFEEIKNGPVAELKDESIRTAFQNAQNRKLEIGIVAAMSSGKSTLINALLGKKLMPVAAKATTSKIVRITHREQKAYSAVAYDENHNVVTEFSDISYTQMKALNANDKVLEIAIAGPIPCVSSVGMELVLVDTPGPNNSRNIRHKMITRNLLNDSDRNPSLVLFVQNATNLSTTDESGILDFVSKSMTNGNKHSRDRYIFVVNKMDQLKPEDDSVVGTLAEAREELEKRNIIKPNLFPVSAQVAFENRSCSQNPLDLLLYRNRYKSDDSVHFDKYYEFSHLPLYIKESLDAQLVSGNEETRIDIHSGIVSIEEAIKLYVNKYARTIKIRDLVESFNRNLQSLAAIAHLRQEIESNEDKRRELQTQVAELKENINSGKEALQFSQKVEKWDFISSARVQINERFASIISDVSSLDIEGNGNKVSVSSAKRMCIELDNKISELIANLLVDISTIINNSFQDSLDSIAKEFVAYINRLNAGIDSSLLSIKEFDLHLEYIYDINKILEGNTKKEKEHYYVEETKTRTIKGSRSQNASRGSTYGGIFGMKIGTIMPGVGNIIGAAVGATVGAAIGYLSGDGDRTVSYTENVKKIRVVEYVDMKSIVENCKEATLREVNNAQEQSLLFLEEQSENIRRYIKDKVSTVNDAVERKATYLSNLLVESHSTETMIQSQKESLDWLIKMQNKVNELVNF